MLLKNCKIVSSSGAVSADILIEDGKIKKIGKTLRGDDTINVKNKPVIPGIVDAHVHMRDFKEGYKEDFLSGSRAALAGGVTTFIDMPNTEPAITTAEVFEERIKIAEGKSLADFGINFGITSNNRGEWEKVTPASYKLYLDGTLGEITEDILTQAFGRLSRISIHAEDSAVIERNYTHLKKKTDFLSYARLRDSLAEELAVKKVCEYAKRHERKTHICHISTRISLRYLNEFTTCEVTPHHLFLTEKALVELEGDAKTNPPLRTPLDLNAMWEGIKTGKIDIIASDHAPHAIPEKERSVFDALPGVPNIEVMLRLVLTQVSKRTLSLLDLVRLMCENPAKIFDLATKGEIKAGKDADMLILDLDKKGKIDAYEFYSKAKYSPFDGWKTIGDVDRVILRGEVVFEDEDFLIKKGYGRCVI